MLLILVLILSAYKQKPIYSFDEELQNKEHNRTSGDEVNKAEEVGYTGDVLSEEYDSQDEAYSNINSDYNITEDKSKDIDYTGGEYSDVDCGEVINSEVVPEYPSKLVIPDANCESVVVSVPVLLSQFEIEFTCEAVIRLDQPALDIKRVKRNVYLDECRFLPNVNKLFIGGMIREDIEYSTEDNIRHATVEVPFRGTTEIEYFTPSVISTKEEQLEIEFDLTEKAYVSNEFFNEKIYCKLISCEIRALDIADKDDDKNEDPEYERLFETLEEKMEVKLNLKLIQEQLISINKDSI
jgi:hypothetical protein